MKVNYYTAYLLCLIITTLLYKSHLVVTFATANNHLDYLPTYKRDFFKAQTPIISRRTDAHAQQSLVDVLNQQLLTAINGAHILVAYIDANLLDQLTLVELTEELTFLGDAYLQPALTAIDHLHTPLLQFLPTIANDTTKMGRLFRSLEEYLPPYRDLLKALLLKAAVENSSIKTATISTAKRLDDDFVATSIVIETGFEYHFHLLSLYSKLLQTPSPPEVVGLQNSWHSAIVAYPLGNTEVIVDHLGDLLPPLYDLSERHKLFSRQQCTDKLLRKMGDSLVLIKGSLKTLKLSSAKTLPANADSLLEKIEAMKEKIKIKKKQKDDDKGNIKSK